MDSSWNNSNRFSGVEFDWFAVDRAGAIGLFSTGGYGDIPIEVVRYYRFYDLITSRLQLPNLGTMAVWKDFAQYGFYVFDWQLYEGPYLKIEPPLATLQEELRNQIMAIPNLPFLSVSFEMIGKVEIEQHKSPS
ncbi:hypothetical protein DNI29_09360 [Hymenobacter sediminis]|uniref:hypothetical protein n=1 Tax=Hymenobacter sediminis TaxID=2218621 RepID=UPI000F4E8A58|nr:hypothetical protein [Hymenobacter sediminis]RPD47649.1 hypothetical protein DNI29_09360 [Hymenobacter sediminis]